MAGRRPKPDELKRLAGNPGHRPLNDQAPKPERGEPEMPRNLRPDGQREWHYMVNALGNMGMLYQVDGKALAAYCDVYSDWMAACKDIKKHGPIIDIYGTNIEGETVFIRREVNCAYKVKNDALRLMKAYLIEFGLTPASRSKLKIEPPKAVDPMEDLLNRNKGAHAIPAAQPSVPDAKEKAPLAFDTGKAEKLAADIPDVGFDA